MPQPLPIPGDVIASKYRVDRELGTGGMGAVFQVTHRVTGKRFALKWLLPQISTHGDSAQRFIREAQVAGRFEHPNVVEVYDVGAEGDSFYMVMELLEGESLASRVESSGPLSVADVCRLLIPCMHGVAEGHAAGIVHRDLKPANIFICGATKTSPEYAKVLDFGISKMSGTEDDLSAKTKSGTLVGTPHYMPLEQMRGREVDHRVDIYAFGVVLYQVLSGKLPYPAESFSDLVLAVAHETPRPLDRVVPRLPRGLAAVVARAMARDAADRHPDLGALVADLETFSDAGSHPSHAPMGGRLPSLSIPTPLSTESSAHGRSAEARSSGLRWMLAGATMVIVVATISALWWRQREAQQATSTEPQVEQPTAETREPAAGHPKAAAATVTEPETRTPASDDPPQIDIVRTEPETPKPEPQREPEALPPTPRTTEPLESPKTARPTRPPRPSPSPAPHRESEVDDVNTEAPEDRLERPARPPGRVPTITEDDFY